MKARKVDLIVTSPPYLQVVNYGTANWIRLWLMGLDEVGRESGAGRKKPRRGPRSPAHVHVV